MKKLLVVLVVAAIFVGVSWSHALAIPNPNGTITAGEWDGSIVVVSDGPEAGIPDNWDISKLYIFQENSGGANDGLYFRLDVYGTPTVAGESGPTPEAFAYSYLDYDGDATDDDLIEANKLGGGEIRVNSVTIAGGAFGVGPHAWEFFVPESALSSKALPGLTKSFLGYTVNSYLQTWR